MNVSIYLQNPIKIPANGQSQEKVADLNQHTMRQVNHVRNNANYACEARDIVDGVNANYTEGFVKRKAVLSSGADASINVILTLNGFGFFNHFFDQTVPNGKVSFDVNFEFNANLFLAATGLNVGRYIVTRFVLWVPKMILKALGEQMLLD